MFFFCKYMKFWNQASYANDIKLWLCLANYDFEARIMLNFSRCQTTGTKRVNSIGLIEFKEKILLMTQIKAGHYASGLQRMQG